MTNETEYGPEIVVDGRLYLCLRDKRGNIIGYTPKPCADQQGASEPLQCAGNLDAPVDHGPAAGAREEAGNCGDWAPTAELIELMRGGQVAADTKQPDFVPCERTVRLAREHIKNAIGMDGYSFAVVSRALESLLPKKDRAEELAEQHARWRVRELADGRQVLADERLCFARWLESRFLLAQGEIRG